MADPDLRTQVAIVGAGPAGMLLSHLLAADGVESVVVETRSEEYVASRIRAGILEQSTVDLLRSTGLGDRLDREGDQHRGIYLQWPDERHHLDFVDLTGRSVWVYGQTEVQKDLIAARTAAGQEIHYEITDTALHDLETDQPVGDVHRRRRCEPGDSWRTSWSAATGRSARAAAWCPTTYAGSGRRSTRTPGSASSPTSRRRPTS